MGPMAVSSEDRRCADLAPPGLGLGAAGPAVGSVETEARRGCGGAARRSGRRWRPDRDGGGGGVELGQD
jgi:hypothetical protein